ncbi:hypothetical protein EJ05DRAFT_507106 [Pseudovirgaria hyperparasitica]|uniref:Zn(2)-C6 fungal-type domain-containing protein n=1 Tax=Pseudovirgaria hyperparasitica TaxID=470096 RepID=A0A6A6WN67_9PEZI|nr:uncharacterized protein EJ05DRAFT_507106 [Pseudovirgaria hyperparasitica]KAF2763526.1 hypothetical protein EJ05DRAFT_507106 [Pseudovirgaria hyperparasitica]
MSSSSTPIPHRRRVRKSGPKSRLGCVNCKNRKIKCQENRPSCDNCQRGHLSCVYPNLVFASFVPGCNAPQRVRMPASLPQIATKSSDEARLFHHYMSKAHPHLPVGARLVGLWTIKIPALATKYDYLQSALLALSASHLSAVSGHQLESQALTHRIAAIRSFNQAISKPASSIPELDSRVATLVALMFQARFMEEGLLEFLMMVRGCYLASGDYQTKPESAFHDLRAEGHLKALGDRLERVKSVEINQHELQLAQESLEEVAPLVTDDINTPFYEALYATLVAARDAPLKAYEEYGVAYNYVAFLPNRDFLAFICPENNVAQVLLAYFFAMNPMNALLEPVARYETDGLPNILEMDCVGQWVLRIFNNVAPEYRTYLRWPLRAFGYVEKVQTLTIHSR